MSSANPVSGKVLISGGKFDVKINFNILDVIVRQRFDT